MVEDHSSLGILTEMGHGKNNLIIRIWISYILSKKYVNLNYS